MRQKVVARPIPRPDEILARTATLIWLVRCPSFRDAESTNGPETHPLCLCRLARIFECFDALRLGGAWKTS